MQSMIHPKTCGYQPDKPLEAITENLPDAEFGMCIIAYITIPFKYNSYVCN